MLRFTQAQMDLLMNQRRAFNEAEQRLAQLFNFKNGVGDAFVGNAYTLPREAWELWDLDLIELQRTQLTVFNDLAASLSRPIPIGKMVAYYGQVSDSGSANVSMDGRSRADADQAVIKYEGIPIPIIDSIYSVGWRQMEAMMADGDMSIIDASRENANRVVAETMESHAQDGNTSIVYGGNAMYGLCTHPARNTRSTTNTLRTATGPEWLADIKATLQLLHDDNYRVPATIYVNWDDWFYASNTDFSTAYPNKTIAQRVLEMGGVKEVIPVQDFAADEILAFIKDRRVVEVLNAMPPITRPKFRANPTDDYVFEVMTASSVLVKQDYEGNCGIAHST